MILALVVVTALGTPPSIGALDVRLTGPAGPSTKRYTRDGNQAITFPTTLSAQKLFRRELLTRHGMRFDESLWTGEDALFTMEAYLRADGVSVIADYTCYYLVGRDDGKHVTKSGGYELRFDSARALMHLIAEHVPAHPLVGAPYEFGVRGVGVLLQVRGRRSARASPESRVVEHHRRHAVPVQQRLRVRPV